MVRILAFVLLLLGIPEVQARSDPWCAPVSVALSFTDQQGRDSVRIDLRSPWQTCSFRDGDEAVGFHAEPKMHIEFYGKAIDVPSSCLAGFGFRLSDLEVAIGDSGIGIKMFGKSADRITKMKAFVYTVDKEVICNKSAE